MPQDDLKNFMSADPRDIANRVIQKQQGKFAGGETGPGLSKQESFNQFQHMDAETIAENIKKKYNLFLPPPPPVLDNGYRPELVKAFMQQEFERRNAPPVEDVPPYATGPKARIGPDNTPPPVTEQPPQYKGQMTWDESGKVIPFMGPKRTYRGPNVDTISPLPIGSQPPPAQQPEYQVDPWQARQQIDIQDRVPTRTEKFFDFFAQPAMRGANTMAWGVPAIVNKVMFGEQMPEPLTIGANITGGLGDLAGLIGPAKFTTGLAKTGTAVNKVLGKAFIPKNAINFTGNLLRQGVAPADVLHATGQFLGKWFPKTVGGDIMKRMTASTISMAGIYAIGENEGENVGEIMLNKLRAMPSGALAGQIFGMASLARFSKLHPMTGWLIRAGATNIALDMLHGTQPLDERALWEKIYSYGLNAWFTRPGTAMNPNDMRVQRDFADRAEKLRKEATAVDKELAQDGLEPVAKSTLEEALRRHAEAMKQPVPPPAGTPELEFMQNVQRIAGEQAAEKVDYSNVPDKRLKEIESSPIRSKEEKDAATAELDKRYAARGPMATPEPGKGTPMFRVGGPVNYRDPAIDANGNDIWIPRQGKIVRVVKDSLTGENLYQIENRVPFLRESEAIMPDNPERKASRPTPRPVPAEVRVEPPKPTFNNRIKEQLQPKPTDSADIRQLKAQKLAEIESAEADFVRKTEAQRASIEERFPVLKSEPEAPKPAPRKRVKTKVVPQADGSVEVTAETEDIPDFKPIQEKAATLQHIVDNPDVYGPEVRRAAEDELTRRGKPPLTQEQAIDKAQEEPEPEFPTKDAKAERKQARANKLASDNARGTGPVDISKMSDAQIANLDIMDFPVGPQRDFIARERVKAARRIILGLKEGDTLVDADGEELEVVGNSDGFVNWVQKSNRKRVGGGGLEQVDGWFIRGGEFAGQDPRVRKKPGRTAPQEVGLPAKPEETFPTKTKRGPARAATATEEEVGTMLDPGTLEVRAAVRGGRLARKGEVWTSEDHGPLENIGYIEASNKNKGFFVFDEGKGPRGSQQVTRHSEGDGVFVSLADLEATKGNLYQAVRANAKAKAEGWMSRGKFDERTGKATLVSERDPRVAERVRQKGIYAKKTWNAQNLISYFMTEEGMDKNAAKVAGRKAYAQYKSDHKWESLINDTTRKRFGGGGKGGGPAQNPPPEAPPRPATGKTNPPPVSPTGAEPSAFPTRSGAETGKPPVVLKGETYPSRFVLGERWVKGNETLTVRGVSDSQKDLGQLYDAEGNRKVVRIREMWEKGWRPIEQTGVYRAKGAPVPVAEKAKKSPPARESRGADMVEVVNPMYGTREKMTRAEAQRRLDELTSPEAYEAEYEGGVDEATERNVEIEALQKALGKSAPVEEEFPTEESGPEIEARAEEYVKPERPVVKPEEVIDVNGEGYWGPLEEGGVPKEHELPKVGDIWTKKARQVNNRRFVRVVGVNSDAPWELQLKVALPFQGEGREIVTRSVYDLWNEGYRPKGFVERGTTLGRTQAPRPTRFLVGPEGLPPGIKPESTPRRSSGKVLSKQAALEAARINQERNAPPVEPREEVFPTRGRQGAGGSEITEESDFDTIERAPLTRNYNDLYQDVLADPRYAKDAEKVAMMLNDQIEKSLSYRRRTKSGAYIAPQVIEDLRDIVHDLVLENFDPSKMNDPDLKMAIKKYVNTTASHEIERHIKRLAEGDQGFVDRGDVTEGGELELGGDFEFREGQNAFILSPGETPGKYPGLKTNEEILEEEAAITAREGSPRQKLARQAFIDVRKKIPLKLQDAFNKYIEAIELSPEGHTISSREFERLTGIPNRSAARYISEFKNTIQTTIESNPEYYDAFVKEAQLLQEYWKRLDVQRKEYVAREKEIFESQQGTLYQSDVLDKYFEDMVRAMTHFPEVGEVGTQTDVAFDDFYHVRPDVVGIGSRSAQRILSETPMAKPEPYTGEPVEKPGPSPEDVAYYQKVDRSLPLDRPIKRFKPHERGAIGDLEGERIQFSRTRTTFGEMNAPRASHVSHPGITELIGKMRDWGDIHVIENIRKASKLSDLIRLPFYNEKMHNLSNTLLDIEGVGSVGTEKAYRFSRPFFTMSKAEKTRVWRAMELEDMTESFITTPNSKSAFKLRAEGIELTAKEKQGYKAMRKALDFVVTDYMPKLMRQSGFSRDDIAKIVLDNYRDGYLPHFRYGDHVLSYLAPVRGERGVRYRRFVESYDTERLRNVREAELRQQGWRDSQGRRHPYEFTKFRFSDVKLDPNSFIMLMEHWPTAERMFAKVAHTENDLRAIELIKRMAKETIEGNFAKGRFAQRKGRMGWSNDYERAVKDYFDHVPFSIARRYMRGQIEDEISKLPSARDKDYGRDLYNFWAGANKSIWSSEGKPTQYVRKAIYDYYLMLKPSFMLQNLTQRMATHLPLAIATSKILKNEGTPGMGGAEASLKGQGLELDIYREAMSNVGEGKPEVSVEQAIKQSGRFSRIEKNVLQRLIDSHELGAMRTRESVGRSFADIRLGKTGPLRYLPSIEIFGILSEKSNRLHSALTALKLYEHMDLNTNELYAKVTDFVRRADFPYSKATRMQVGRGFIGSNMFVFKSYLNNYIRGFMPYLYNNDPKSALAASAIFLGLAGAMGVPGYGLLRKGVKAILPGTDLDKEKKISQYEDAFDASLGGTLAHGVPALVGVDGSSWFGFPDLLSFVPVTASENLRTNLLTRLMSHDGSLSWREAITRLAPSYFKHWLRMGQMNSTGSISTDRYGAPTVTPQDINKFSGTVKEWAMEEYHKLPTPEAMSELEKALYTVVGTPSLTASRYYNRVERIKEVGKMGREAAGEYNRTMANMFIDNLEGSDIADEMMGWQSKDFDRNFWALVESWPKDEQNKLDELIQEAKDKGWKFNMPSVLTSIQERLERVRRK